MPEYPILQQNKPIGTLRVTREGLHTVFSARAKTDAPRLRLAVCGARSRAYLGLMLPDGSGALTLQKRLTRLECARLPQEILFAADEAWDIPYEPSPSLSQNRRGRTTGWMCSGIPRRTACSRRLTASGRSSLSRRTRRTSRAAHRPCCGRSTGGRI